MTDATSWWRPSTPRCLRGWQRCCGRAATRWNSDRDTDALGRAGNGCATLGSSLMSMHTASPQAQASANGAAQPRKPRKQRAINPKFPCAMNFGITLQMAQAVLRQCPRSSPFQQSDIGRLALHMWLLANDESYRREIAADGAANEVRHA